jgi:hypothetical protein
MRDSSQIRDVAFVAGATRGREPVGRETRIAGGVVETVGARPRPAFGQEA